MATVSDFKNVLQDASQRFYDYATDRDYGCLDELVKCNDGDDVEQVLDDYRNSDEGIENFNSAVDDSMIYYADMWAVIIEYANPVSVFSAEFNGLDTVYYEFEDDVFKKTKNMIVDNLEKLKHEVQEGGK